MANKGKVVRISEELLGILDGIMERQEEEGFNKPSYYSASKSLAKKWWFKKL